MSDFRLYPVPQNKLSCLEALFNSARIEMKMEKRSDPAYTLARVEDGYDTRSMAAYVDSLQDPKHCLVLAILPGIVTNENIAVVILIYSAPEHRNNPDAVKALMETIENYARHERANSIMGSSWKYGCKRPIDSLWTSHGYTEQETTYVKLL